MNLTGIKAKDSYRGILNLAGSNQILDTTLRNVTDGMGNNSPLQLSTASVSFGGSTGLNWDNANTRLGIGTNTPLGILHLKTAAATTRLLLDGDAAQSKIITYRTAGLQRFGLYTNNTAESGANAGSDFAIRAYSDAGTLLSTPIFIKRSTGNVGIGTTSASARLHVRGDGTNPIARFETSGGTASHIFKDTTALEFGNQGINISATSNGTNKTTSGRGFLFEGVSGQSIYQFNFLASANSETSGTWGGINLTSGVSSGAGSGNLRPLNIAYTINNSGAQTGTATGIFINATETALNGMGHNLLDLQVGGVSKFKVFNSGGVVASGVYVNGITRSFITSPSDGIVTLYDSGATSFNRLQFGGTTNAFPAIKRNSAAIDFRLADDSGYADVNMGQATFGGGNGYIGINNASSIDSALRNVRTNSGSSPLSISTGEVGVGDVTTYASAIFAIGSTTRGFLPPRMTTTQVNAIASPAEGLVVFNTTTSHLCVYQSGGWVKMNHSPM
jgi:hypothetical protein